MLDNNLVLRKALSHHMELDDDDYSGKLGILNLALILPKYKKKMGIKARMTLRARWHDAALRGALHE
jgi:hypothetical protein